MVSKIVSTIGTYALRFISFCLYEIRIETEGSTKKIKDRELNLNDLVRESNSFTGKDPNPSSEVWIASDDFEFQTDLETIVSFNRKIEYKAENRLAQSMAFVVGRRKIKKYSNFRTRRLRWFWRLFPDTIKGIFKLFA